MIRPVLYLKLSAISFSVVCLVQLTTSCAIGDFISLGVLLRILQLVISFLDCLLQVQWWNKRGFLVRRIIILSIFSHLFSFVLDAWFRSIVWIVLRYGINIILSFNHFALAHTLNHQTVALHLRSFRYEGLYILLINGFRLSALLKYIAFT